MNQNKIIEIYHKLLHHYGPQGWWPFINIGYHKEDYSYPKNDDQFFEIVLGSILTQNTTFVSVQKALQNLNDLDALNLNGFKKLSEEQIKDAIRPAGYFNQKFEYIKNFILFFEELNGKIPNRDQLLSLKGIGEETADSILLFAYQKPQFKCDAYTKRLLVELKLINEKQKYKHMKQIFEDALEPIFSNKEERVIIYQEFHALIVEHGKHYYSKKPYGINCFLKEER